MNKFEYLNKILDKVILIIFIVLVGLIFYTFYRSEILYDGLYRDYYLKYYIFLISLFFILIALNFLNKEIKLTIYIILISTIAGLYIAEILLFDFKNLGNKTKYQFYIDLKKENDVVVAVQPLQYILYNINQKKIFPLSGISNKLTILCQRPEDKKFITYNSDRYGFRNKDINWDKEKIDFVLLGDSFVHGSCVSSDYIISSQLSTIYRDKFNKEINTINLAFSGNGPLLEYATLKEYLKYIKVKKVFYFFYEGNDFLNLSLELKDPFLKRYLKDEFQQKLIEKQIAVDSANQNLLEQEVKKKRIGFYKFIKLGRVRSLLSQFLNQKLQAKSAEPSENIYEAYNNILIDLKKLTKNQNAELYFVYLPYIKKFSNNDYDLEGKIHSKVISMVKALDIKYIDLLSEFKSELDDPLSMFQLGKYQHLNEQGYKFLAETIVKKINK